MRARYPSGECVCQGLGRSGCKSHLGRIFSPINKNLFLLGSLNEIARLLFESNLSSVRRFVFTLILNSGICI